MERYWRKYQYYLACAKEEESLAYSAQTDKDIEFWAYTATLDYNLARYYLDSYKACEE